MTICIAIITSEGIVLATDSASTLVNTNGILHVSPHAIKLNQIKNFLIGTMTWGLGSINDRTINSLINDFSRQFDPSKQEDVTVENIAKKLYAFIWETFGPIPLSGRKLGIAVGGYSFGSHFPELREINFENNTIKVVVNPKNFGAIWFGQPDVLTRLLRGFDPELINYLKTNCGLLDDKINEIYSKFNYPIPWGTMPLQEAVDCIVWMIYTVIGKFQFVIGPPICSKPIRVAVITQEKGFQWIRQEQLQFPLEKE